MRERATFVMVLGLLAACGAERPTHEGTEAQPATAATTSAASCDHAMPTAPTAPQAQAAADGARTFGAPMTGVAPTALADVVASPDRFAGQVVHVDGTIERVCQRMGCWMELRAENVEPVRVPMAGHAFFLPRDVQGRSASVEGRVAVQPLSAARRAHLESEGALATAASLAIEATSVVVR